MTDDIQRALGRIEGKSEEILRRLNDYEKRITALEQRTWKWAGAISVLMIIWTFVSHKVLAAVGLK